MHSYLKAIGFSKITKNEFKELLNEACLHPDGYEETMTSDQSEIAELKFETSAGMGLIMRGSYNEQDEFVLDYYFPYFESDHISTFGRTEIIKQSDRDGYQGLTEDNRLGIDLIYHVQNMVQILSHNIEENTFVDVNGVSLTGLATEGTIILPTAMPAGSRERKKMLVAERIALIEAAKEGNQEAFDKLNTEDMDLYSSLNDRIVTEDILTIVNSTFMPSGIESDKYAIIGDILSCRKVQNELTLEDIYIMNIECNDVDMEICINAGNLLGEPEAGRRFKGSVWIQGKIEL